jgi:hypothetical protein
VALGMLVVRALGFQQFVSLQVTLRVLFPMAYVLPFLKLEVLIPLFPSACDWFGDPPLASKTGLASVSFVPLVRNLGWPIRRGPALYPWLS